MSDVGYEILLIVHVHILISSFFTSILSPSLHYHVSLVVYHLLLSLSYCRRAISFELQRKKMMRVLKENQPVCLLPFFRDSVIENKVFDVLATLDQS